MEDDKRDEAERPKDEKADEKAPPKHHDLAAEDVVLNPDIPKL